MIEKIGKLYKEHLSFRIVIIIGVSLFYIGLSFVTIVLGGLGAIEYITVFLLILYVISLILFFIKFRGLFYVPIILAIIVIRLSFIDFGGKSCDVETKLSNIKYYCDCGGLKQYDIMTTRCLFGERKCYSGALGEEREEVNCSLPVFNYDK